MLKTLKLFALVIFISIPINILSNKNIQQNYEKEQKEQITILQEEVLDYALKQKDNLEYVLEHMMQLINKGTIKVNKEEDVLKWANDIKIKLYSIKNSFFSYVTPEKIYKLIIINNECIDILSQALKSNFKKLKPLAVEKILTQKTKDISLENLQILAFSNQKKMDILTQEAENSGINIVNKIYRKLEKFNKNYKVLPSSLNFAVTTVGLATLIYVLPNPAIEYTKLSWLIKLKKFIGTPKFYEEEMLNALGYMGEPTQQGIKEKSFDCLDQLAMMGARKTVATTTTTSKGSFAIVDAIAKLQKNYNFMLALPFMPLAVNQIKKTGLNFGGWSKSASYNLHYKLQGSDTPKHLYLHKEDITTTFDDVVGCRHAKQILKDVVDYIMYPERFDRSGTDIGRGILLYGPPGTGKTLSVRALAGEIQRKIGDCAFKEVTWWELMQKSVKGVLAEAQKNTPCVLFIDEIDSLQLQRDNREQWSNFLTEFLTEMSGLNSDTPGNNRVILIAATNKIEHLDEALKRYGRFGTQIRFDLPNNSERKSYFEQMFNKFAINTEEINIEKLAKETRNCAYSDLEEVVKYAQFIAKTNKERLNFDHLQISLDKKIRKISSSIELTEQEVDLLSTHYAGHVLTHMLLNPVEKISKVTILPIDKKIKEHLMFGDNGQNKKARKDVKYGAIFTHRDDEIITINSEIELIKNIKISLSGHISEKIILGSTGYTFHKKDKKKALELTKEILLEGLDYNNLPKNLKEKYLEDSYNKLQKYEKEVTELLENNKELLIKIKDELKNKNSLTYDEITSIINEYA